MASGKFAALAALLSLPLRGVSVRIALEDVKEAVLDAERTDDEPLFVCPARCLRCCQQMSVGFFADRSHFKCITRTQDNVRHIPGHFCTEPEPRSSDPLETKLVCEYQRQGGWRELAACTNTNVIMSNGMVDNSEGDMPPARLTNGQGNVAAGTRCVLPFQFDGVEHVDCIGSSPWHGGFGWCSTGSYRYEDAEEWGGCERPLRVVRTWRAPPAALGASAAWPEDEYLPEVNGPRIGICLSGGGSRAYSASIGALRGLHDLGILQRARYISGVSGGSWATSVYTFAQMAPESSDDVLLGESWEPEEITLEKLDVIDSRSGRAAPVDYDAAVAMGLSGIGDAAVFGVADRIYESVVNSQFLEPYGVSLDSLMTWDNRSLADVLARNPSLGDRDWVMPRRNRPYPIIQTAMAGPMDLRPSPLEKRKYTQAEVTPLYIGRALTSNISYEQAITGARGTVEVGGFIEPIGVGATPPASGLRAGESQGTLRVAAPDREFSVGRAIAQSSWAIGAFTSQYLLLSDTAMAHGYPYWSPESLHPTRTEMSVVDGGCQDNLGIMSLLRRGVERIIMIDNTAMPLVSRSVWDPAARLPVNGEVDDTIAWMFGVDVDQGNLTASWDYTKNQVFALEDFAPYVAKLQDAQAAGVGAVATMRLTTVENEWWGIPAGQVVDLTTVYNSRVTAWEERLPDEVRQAVFPESGEQSRSWENFPHLATTLAFGRQQVNLLATLTSSAIKLNAANAFGHILQDGAPGSAADV